MDLAGVHYGWRLAGDDSWLGGGRYYPALVMLDPYSRYIAELSLPENVQAAVDGAHKGFLGKLHFPEKLSHPEVLSAPAVPLEAMVVQEIDVAKFTSSLAVLEHHRGKLLGILGGLPLRLLACSNLTHSPCGQHLLRASSPYSRYPTMCCSPGHRRPPARAPGGRHHQPGPVAALRPAARHGPRR